MDTTAIIVAAGTGSRFTSNTPKQLIELCGKPVFVHAVERFQAAPSVATIVLVVPADKADDFRSNTTAFDKIAAIVPGGSTRAESVLNGLNAATDSEIVAVHDGARPFVTVDEIERTIAKARELGAACLVGPVTDTIKTVQRGEISGTLDRTKLRRALTPQVFRTELLRRAFDGSDLSDAVTDECYLVEKLGHPIAVVEGSPRNIKITHPEDLALAEALSNEMRSGK